MYSYLVIPFSEYCQEISKVGQIIQDLWRLCNFTRCPSIMKDLPKFEDRTAGLRFKRICSLADCKKKESGTLWTRHNWVFHRHRGRISENDDVQQVVICLLISSTLNIVSIFFWLRIVLVVIHWNSFLFTKPSLFTSNILWSLRQILFRHQPHRSLDTFLRQSSSDGLYLNAKSAFFFQWISLSSFATSNSRSMLDCLRCMTKSFLCIWGRAGYVTHCHNNRTIHLPILVSNCLDGNPILGL